MFRTGQKASAGEKVTGGVRAGRNCAFLGQGEELLRQLKEEERIRRQLGEDKIRRLGEELFASFRETATGMMENIQEAEDNAGEAWDRMTDSFLKSISSWKKGGGDGRGNL